MLADNVVILDPLDLGFGESQMSGSLYADLQDVPDIKLSAQAPLIDLAPFFPAEEENEKPATPSPETGDDKYVFKDEPLPLDTLRKANADFAITIDTLRTSSAEYKDFVFRLSLASGQLEAENNFKGLYGGTIENKVAMTIGENTIDLNTEKLNTDFNTKPREGVGLSADAGKCEETFQAIGEPIPGGNAAYSDDAEH
jgi:uncharacterized protein involved in outer membrane biogenesis